MNPKFYYTRQLGHLNIIHGPSKDMIADLLIKSLTLAQYNYLTEGILNLSSFLQFSTFNDLVLISYLFSYRLMGKICCHRRNEIRLCFAVYLIRPCKLYIYTVRCISYDDGDNCKIQCLKIMVVVEIYQNL